jgi:DUF971 family protein
MLDRPVHLDLKKDEGLSVQWPDGSSDFFPIAFLRRMSPSAETKHLREEMAKNPLTVLPASAARAGPLTAIDAQLVGNYAIRIRFSDGHDTGIYSWQYLRELAKQVPPATPAAESRAPE